MGNLSESKFGFKQYLNEIKYYPSGRQKLVYDLCLAAFFFVLEGVLAFIRRRPDISVQMHLKEVLPEQVTLSSSFNTDFFTFLLVLVTAIYVFLTHRILKANRQTVSIMEEQHEASLRPYIVLTTFMAPGNMMICLKISNTGKTVADNVKLELDRDFYQYGEKYTKYNLKNAYGFQSDIKTFIPGMELLYYLGMEFQIFKDDINQQITPSQFKITATYNYSGKKVSEETFIDLESYRKTNLPPQEAVVTQLKEIVKAIRETKQE